MCVRAAFFHCTVERDSLLNIAECISCNWGDTGIESGLLGEVFCYRRRW